MRPEVGHVRYQTMQTIGPPGDPPFDLRRQAEEKRRRAAHARNLAALLSNGDRQRLIDYATELEQEAAALEQRARGTPKPEGI